MKSFARIAATGVALTLVLAACTSSGGDDAAGAGELLRPDATPFAVVDHEALVSGDAQIIAAQAVYAPGFVSYASPDAAFETDPVSGTDFFNDQLILTAIPGTSAEQVAELVEPLGGLVVGLNLVLNSFQVAFDSAKPLGALETLIYQLSSEPIVARVELNYPEIPATPLAVDPVNDSLWQGHWGSALGNGDGTAGNWGMQAIGAPVVWDIAEELSTVKVGVYDVFFQDQSVPDLGEYTLIHHVDLYAADEETDSSHGPHVAGTIGARVNNGLGVAGVAPNANLYAVSHSGVDKCVDTLLRRYHLTDQDGNVVASGRCGSHKFAQSLGFSVLLAYGAKVINYSMGPADAIIGQAEQYDSGHEPDLVTSAAVDYLAQSAENHAELFKDLKDAGYDFLVIAAAGNSSGGMSKDEAGLWVPAASELAVAPSFDWPVSAARHQFYAARDLEPELEDNILIVGAMGSVRERGGQGYEIAKFSEYSVDLVAPGVGIASTIQMLPDSAATDPTMPSLGCAPALCPTAANNHEGITPSELIVPQALRDPDDDAATPTYTLPAGYGTMSGTSMAAPHVSGVAAAIWGANPGLSAAQVKSIIMDTAINSPLVSKNPNFSDRHAERQLNAAAAIRDALATRDSWHDQRSYTDVPTALKGTWCLGSDAKACLNFDDLLQAHPGSSFAYATSTYLPAFDETGRISTAATFKLCLAAACVADSDYYHFAYYPPGAQWPCIDHPEGQACDPYALDELTQAHDIAWPRIVYQHQLADGTYVDAEPFKLDLRRVGEFAELPLQGTAGRQPITLGQYFDGRDYTDIPAELQGTWCLSTDGDVCVNFADFFADNPDSGFDEYSPLDFDSAEPTIASICLIYQEMLGVKNTCSMAATVLIKYYPPGSTWDCIADGADYYNLDGCDPDFTDEHRIDEPRIVKLVNHQHNPAFVDVAPLYRSTDKFGHYPNLLYDY